MVCYGVEYRLTPASCTLANVSGLLYGGLSWAWGISETDKPISPSPAVVTSSCAGPGSFMMIPIYTSAISATIPRVTLIVPSCSFFTVLVILLKATAPITHAENNMRSWNRYRRCHWLH
ncbi:hypothetical protein K449DRAFT_77444 [Hypoxylon sp. EC38]|nr:hypothetical protein K449DRAFT_77444 [Hypoxylon sp. EC38]